ncbi:Cytidylyltransferase family domain containing protein [Amanita muscaria]
MSFASKTAFDALAVQSGQDSDDEPLTDSVDTPTHSDTPSKPSKSALKKAQKLARTERRHRERAAAKQAKLASQHELSSEPESTPSMAGNVAPVFEPPRTRPSTVPAAVPSVPDEPRRKQNGDAHDVPHPVQQPPEPPVQQRVPAPGVVEPAKPQEKPTPSAQEVEKLKKRQSFLTRTLWTFIMIGGFIGLLLMGHAYMILLVMVCQTLVYREVTTLFSLKSSSPESREAESLNEKDPWSKTLNWYFFAVTNYFLYGESIIYYFKHVVFADAQLLPFATNHRIISFTLYTIGFMGFVMSLKKGYLKQQFGLFCWVHMSLLLIVVSSHFIINNILEGLIWLWVPASLVICNDVFAYLCGITLGRTPLIKLSPKKTVEGFVGAFWCTIIFGILWGTYFMRFNYMICPVHDLGVNAWSSIQCKPNPAFLWREIRLWKPLAAVFSHLLGRTVTTLPYARYQLHLLFMACFASLVAPFGGFFASGFKRAFNIKDFGHSIPGHGGMTDRMDCQ